MNSVSQQHAVEVNAERVIDHLCGEVAALHRRLAVMAARAEQAEMELAGAEALRSGKARPGEH
jgi:hypothetical protein